MGIGHRAEEHWALGISASFSKVNCGHLTYLRTAINFFKF